jgi:hypothetical protein
MRSHRFLFGSLVPLAVALAGCSDPVPPTPQGAWNANFGPSADATSCMVAQHTAGLGKVNPNDYASVVSVVAGTDSTDLRCSVTGDKTFEVHGHAERKGIGLDISIPKITASASEQSPASGTVSFVSDKTVQAYVSDPANPCQFYFADPKEGVSAGKVWVAFKCPNVSITMSTCQISQGFAIFENCTSETGG